MGDSNKVKIISDGTPFGTKVLNSDGVEIPNITEISTHICFNQLMTATIKFTNIEVDVAAETNDYSQPDVDGGYFMTGDCADKIRKGLEWVAWQRHPLKQWANRKIQKSL